MILYQCPTKQVTTSEVNCIPDHVYQHVIKGLKVHAMPEHLLIQGI